MADTTTDPGSDFDVVSALMDYEMGEVTGEQVLDLFSHLLSSGMINSLQGHYERQAFALLGDGWLSLDGTILRYPDEG